MTIEESNTSDLRPVQRELITGSVVIAAIVMFIWTGGSAMSAAVRYFTGVGPSVEQILLTALLLNIALILFGWRRYRDLEIEVHRRREAEERARSLAETDPLTGFCNRRSLAEKGAALLAEARSSHQAVAMLLLDLDHFKTINDVHGHAAGDHVLIIAAQRIKALMPPSAVTARLGGDEFACTFLFDPHMPDVVDRIAGQLVRAVAGPVSEGGLHLRVSTSLGIARSDMECDTMEALMRHADIAMYCAKKQGRNRYAWFDAAVERELNVRSLLEAGIRRGIPRGEFVPYYEPQYDLFCGRLTGFEMIPHWNHPTDGHISAEIFAPLAEESGLLAELSLAVMRRAMVEARDWDSALILSANISPLQMKDAWFSQKIRKLLVETGFPPSRLELEIAESTMFENLPLAETIIGSLKNQGSRIALDDCGTSYGSLASLRALSIDRVKISSSLISTVTQDESATVVSTIVHLADNLGLPVTALGIESGATKDRLRELGCTIGQGSYLGKPMPLAEALRVLAERDLLFARPHDDAAIGNTNIKGHHTAIDRKAV